MFKNLLIVLLLLPLAACGEMSEPTPHENKVEVMTDEDTSYDDMELVQIDHPNYRQPVYCIVYTTTRGAGISCDWPYRIG